MKINPETKPLNEIFSIEGRQRYYIPTYQRNYSWATDNIDELFNDITNGEVGYYIGNIVVTNEEKKNDISNYSVVDGQQRLTTIALLYLAIHERLTNEIEDLKKINDYEKGMELAVVRSHIKDKLTFSDGSSKLVLLRDDQIIYENLLSTMYGGERKAFGNRILINRYRYIFELTNDSLETSDDIRKFYDKLNLVELLRITANDISDAFAIFSSINAKGMPLTLIDLMKANYMGYSIGLGNSEDSVEQKWDKLIDILTLENASPNSSLITQFILNNYDTFHGNHTGSLTRNLALKKYQEIFQNDDGSYIDSLIHRASIFSYISPNTVGSEMFKCSDQIITSLNRLKKLDSSQSYPLTMFLLEKYSRKLIKDDVIVEVLEILIKFFVRRNLSQKPKSSNIRAKILEIVKTLNKDENPEYLMIVNSKLLGISVSDSEFAISLSEGVYDISPNTVRYVLIYLERKYGSYFNKQILDTLDDTFISKKSKNQTLIWTIEHILPRNPKLPNGWDVMLSPQNIEISPMIHQDNVDKIGNLTLSGYNSEMGDKSFLDKKDYVSNKSSSINVTNGLRTPLFLNESILGKDENFDDKDTWNAIDINRRSEYLSKLIVSEFSL